MPTTAPFRAKRLDLGGFISSKIIRDHTKRKVFREVRATKASTSIPCQEYFPTSANPCQAQLQLSQMHCYTRPTQIQNRCVMGGVARGVFRAFRMGRFQFRMNALAGNLPGVKKASW